MIYSTRKFLVNDFSFLCLTYKQFLVIYNFVLVMNVIYPVSFACLLSFNSLKRDLRVVSNVNHCRNPEDALFFNVC